MRERETRKEENMKKIPTQTEERERERESERQRGYTKKVVVDDDQVFSLRACVSTDDKAVRVLSDGL